jgi:hypothetical protein
MEAELCAVRVVRRVSDERAAYAVWKIYVYSGGGPVARERGGR